MRWWLITQPRQIWKKAPPGLSRGHPIQTSPQSGPPRLFRLPRRRSIFLICISLTKSFPVAQMWRTLLCGDDSSYSQGQSGKGLLMDRLVLSMALFNHNLPNPHLGPHHKPLTFHKSGSHPVINEVFKALFPTQKTSTKCVIIQNFLSPRNCYQKPTKYSGHYFPH